MLGQSLSGRGIFDEQTIGRHKSFEMIEKGCGVFLCPQIYIQGMNLVQIFLLVLEIIVGEMPSLVVLHRLCVQHERQQCRL